MLSLGFFLSYYVPGQKPGGGATSHAKRAGRRSDPKFDDCSQNSSEFAMIIQKSISKEL
jgi:hypothetical protein